MTDETPAPAAEPIVPAHDQPSLPATTEPKRSPLLTALVILALVMVVGGIALWRQGAGATDQVAQLQSKLDAMQAQIAQLQARPVAAPTDLRPLEQRVAALDARQLPNLAPLDQRLTALENKPPAEAKLDAAGQQQIAALSGRVDGVAARQDQLGTREQADVAKLEDELGAIDKKVDTAVASGTAVSARADKAGSDVAALTLVETRTARLQAAAVALGAGQPLGDIPGAPPALAQFAAKPPPTEAGLRLSFAAAARATQQAGQPPKEDTPFFSRLWNRAQSGLVVREGDRVIIGDVVTGVLEHARHQLEAGDLAGAVAALNGLAGPAAAAMAPWRAEAQSLLDARASLLTVAHG